MVTCWFLIDTIAMIGSPATRGAVASVGRAGWGCLTAASADGTRGSASSAALVASVTIAAAHHCGLAAVECALLIRSVMPWMFSINQPAVNKDLRDLIWQKHASRRGAPRASAHSTGRDG